MVVRGVAADEIKIAVATNFTAAMNDLVARFEQQTEHTVLVSSGSTGNHYAQIKNGAPFEAFFSADSERPRLLEQEGNAVAGSRFLYAVGRLVLWSPRAGVRRRAGAACSTRETSGRLRSRIPSSRRTAQPRAKL